MQAEKRAEAGVVEAKAVWLRGIRAIKELLRTAPLSDGEPLRQEPVSCGFLSGASSRHQERIDGCTRAGLGTYHIQHIKELVSTEFAESRLGGHLLQTFVERQPRLSGEAIAQIFRAANATDVSAFAPSRCRRW